MGLRSGSLESLRDANRMRVIDTLRRRGAISRADIARETGLSRTTVSSLVADLQDRGLVVERPDGTPARSGQGRPPVLLTLDPSAGALLGVDLGHRHLRIAVSDLTYTVLAERKVDLEIDHDAATALDRTAQLFTELVAEAGIDADRVLTAGMGLPGPIDVASRRVQSKRILPGWVGIDPAAELGDRLGLPVHLDNDANVGALGECLLGAGRDARVMAYVRMSAGIGLGLVFDGRPFRGAHGIAGEIGHVLVDPNGPVCRCGNRGCLETLVSGPALIELLAPAHGPLTEQEMVQRAAAGDAACRRVIHDAGTTVGRALADLCNYLNPDVIVVGGELSAAGELLLEPLRDAVHRNAIPAAADDVRVVSGELGERAELLGALALAGHESQDPLAAVMPRNGVTTTTQRAARPRTATTRRSR